MAWLSGEKVELCGERVELCGETVGRCGGMVEMVAIGKHACIHVHPLQAVAGRRNRIEYRMVCYGIVVAPAAARRHRLAGPLWTGVVGSPLARAAAPLETRRSFASPPPLGSACQSRVILGLDCGSNGLESGRVGYSRVELGCDGGDTGRNTRLE